jgi:hypothetical protein
MAACWTWGLHQNNQLTNFTIDTGGKISGQVVTFAGGAIKATTDMGKGAVDLQDVNQIYFSFDKKVTVQLCLANTAGKTQNTKAYKSGQMIDIPAGSRITALRLSDT